LALDFSKGKPVQTNEPNQNNGTSDYSAQKKFKSESMPNRILAQNSHKPEITLDSSDSLIAFIQHLPSLLVLQQRAYPPTYQAPRCYN
jgi:hypothetical protein